VSDSVIVLDLKYASGTVNTSGDSTLIAAQGTGKQIVVSMITIQNESATETTALIKNDGATQLRFVGVSKPDGIVWTFPPGRELRVADNRPLVINLSGANQWGYTIQYRVEGA
jgi:hypothetical protein